MGRIRNKKLLQQIALTIKEIRKEAGISQEDVYNDINVHMGRIEAAKSNITISTLSSLTNYFNISLSDFFKRVEKGRR